MDVVPQASKNTDEDKREWRADWEARKRKQAGAGGGVSKVSKTSNSNNSRMEERMDVISPDTDSLSPKHSPEPDNDIIPSAEDLHEDSPPRGVGAYQ